MSDDSDPGRKRSVFKWSVTIVNKGRLYTGDYSAGLAHCTKSREKWLKETNGEYGRNTSDKHIPNNLVIAQALQPRGVTAYDCEGIVYPIPPTAARDLENLQGDAQAGESLPLKDFCSELGYDSDSRKAERVWRACQETRGHMQKLFGADFEAFMGASENEDE